MKKTNDQLTVQAVPANNGPLFIDDYKAAERYGKTRRWFQRARFYGGGPPFVKTDSGSCLYHVPSTDEWFLSRTVANTSEASEKRRQAATSISTQGCAPKNNQAVD